MRWPRTNRGSRYASRTVMLNLRAPDDLLNARISIQKEFLLAFLTASRSHSGPDGKGRNYAGKFRPLSSWYAVCVDRSPTSSDNTSHGVAGLPSTEQSDGTTWTFSSKWQAGSDKDENAVIFTEIPSSCSTQSPPIVLPLFASNTAIATFCGGKRHVLVVPIKRSARHGTAGKDRRSSYLAGGCSSSPTCSLPHPCSSHRARHPRRQKKNHATPHSRQHSPSFHRGRTHHHVRTISTRNSLGGGGRSHLLTLATPPEWDY